MIMMLIWQTVCIRLGQCTHSMWFDASERYLWNALNASNRTPHTHLVHSNCTDSSRLGIHNDSNHYTYINRFHRLIRLSIAPILHPFRKWIDFFALSLSIIRLAVSALGSARNCLLLAILKLSLIQDSITIVFSGYYVLVVILWNVFPKILQLNDSIWNSDYGLSMSDKNWTDF